MNPSLTWFSYLHPLSKCVYLISLAICVMLVMNPFTLTFAFIALLCYVKRTGAGDRIMPGFFAFLAGLMIVINMLFNHRGTHVLFYLFDRPITLESFLWGFSSALVLLCVILISVIWGESVSTAEFLYVFGKFIPQTALLISMTCSFAVLFAERISEIKSALAGKGIDIKKGGLRKRIGDGTQIMNVLVAYSLENALITSKSMKARGYALRKRTNHLHIKIRTRDYVFLLFTFIVTAAVLTGDFLHLPAFAIFPSFSVKYPTLFDMIFYLLFFLLSAAPLFRVGAYKNTRRRETAA
ncbi:MAG: energy-coupling factor transporter transmembrane component T [Bacillota bacterium]|nr:energy-coupling factor transporter transmembrane component T [Bacillota bacterium]